MTVGTMVLDTNSGKVGKIVQKRNKWSGIPTHIASRCRDWVYVSFNHTVEGEGNRSDKHFRQVIPMRLDALEVVKLVRKPRKTVVHVDDIADF